jgi:uncharacterized delta-60 repeat protein
VLSAPRGPLAITFAVLLLSTSAGRCGVVPGELDWTFDPNVDSAVRAIAVQPDEKIVIGGDFSLVNGTARACLARLLPNGRLDEDFAPIANAPVYSVAVLPDGKILIGGHFTTVNGTTRHRIARLHPNGSVDTAFNPSANNLVRTVSMMSDGRFVAGGFFDSIAGGARTGSARLTPAGALDPSFNPGTIGEVYSTELLPDGRLLAGGLLSYSGPAAQNLAALLPSGAVDTSFTPAANGIVRGTPVQADGRIVISGNFTTVSGQSRGRIARLMPNGSLDPSFNPGLNDTAYTTVLQADGKILTGGVFTFAGNGARRGIARFHADGSLDTEFPATTNGLLFAIALQTDGRVLIGGQFTSVNGTARNRLARLWNDEAIQELNVPGADRIQWLREGSSPEASQVTFEHAAGEKGPWTALGGAVRIAGGWELAGLNLPAGGFIRARARMNCAYGCGSSSLVETIAPWSLAGGIEAWRQAHFGTNANSGDAANSSDPDHDGVDNLAEYAFGLDPAQHDAGSLPRWQAVPGGHALSFTQPSGATGLAILAEHSTSLEPDAWTVIPSSTAPPLFSFFAPAVSAPRSFLRLRVLALSEK